MCPAEARSAKEGRAHQPPLIDRAEVVLRSSPQFERAKAVAGREQILEPALTLDVEPAARQRLRRLRRLPDDRVPLPIVTAELNGHVKIDDLHLFDSTLGGRRIAAEAVVVIDSLERATPN